MIPTAVSKTLGTLFSIGVLGPIRVGSALLPEAIWTPLERLSLVAAGAAARAARPFLTEPGQHPLQAAMRFVDLAEGLVGIQGEWEVVDQHTAVRRVHHCPHARGLRRTSEFCTRMGLVLGQSLSQQLVDDPSVHFEVVNTLSQGHECCEYQLSVARA